ncbi:MAG: right-handed parallel beta-helix repeat-containing protein [Verrucomicrobiota bacterium]
MDNTRRTTLLQALILVGWFALIGITPGRSAASSSVEQNKADVARMAENDWLNVRECGVSGSKFETTAATIDGSKEITVENVGDFQVGQGVMVSRCNIRYTPTQLWGTGLPYYNKKSVEGSVEIRGYDGSAGSWSVYVVDIEPSSSRAFRWTDDLGRTWHPKVPITHDWQHLSGGIEVRFNQRDWESGYVAAFGARDQLISRIEKIEGNVLTLRDAANRTVQDAVVRHNDTFALQEAVDRAIKEKRKLYVPAGNYRLAQAIRVKNAEALVIEGAGAGSTIFDISEGEGACFEFVGGREVTIRNVRLVGFMGFDERDKAGELATRGSTHIWGFQLKPCNAITITDTERVLVENCHASRMSGECFVSAGRSRAATKPGQTYSQGITYLRCSVTDSARNAFNDVMCGAENTSILNCRIVDVGGCSWEGASRFVKFIGNYVRNAGTVAMGNLGPPNRDDSYPSLGAGQHIVADNTFEQVTPYGGCAIRSAAGATQVIIRNNVFVNFGSSAVEVWGRTHVGHFSSSNTIIVGNSFDMTCVGQKSVARTAILISANDTTISDNQIYVRGPLDPLVTGIRLCEPALNLVIHDNLIRSCGVGVVSERGEAQIEEVVDDRTFLRTAWPSGLPHARINPEMSKGWNLAWRNASDPPGRVDLSIVDSFDPESLRFRLREPRPMRAGDRMDVIAPSLAWNLHHNTITDCLRPVVLDSYGSNTSSFSENLVIRGTAANVTRAVEVHGRFQFFSNRLVGFDEAYAAALALYPDALGRTPPGRYQGNTFENCFTAMTESQPGLWKGAMTKDNLAIDCAHALPK